MFFFLLIFIIPFIESQYNCITPIQIRVNDTVLISSDNVDVLLEIDQSKLVSPFEYFCEDMKFQYDNSDEDDTSSLVPYFIESGCNTTDLPLTVWLHLVPQRIKFYMNTTFKPGKSTHVNITMLHGNQLAFLDKQRKRQVIDGRFFFPSVDPKGCPKGYSHASQWEERYIRGANSESVNAMLGSLRHRHTFSAVTSTPVPNTYPNLVTGINNNEVRADLNHYHIIQQEPTDYVYNKPKYFDVHFCMPVSSMFEIHPGFLFFHPSFSLGSSIMKFEDADGRFLRIANSKYGIGKGSTTSTNHEHSIQADVFGDEGTSVNEIYTYEYQGARAITTKHTHHYFIPFLETPGTDDPEFVTCRLHQFKGVPKKLPNELLIITNATMTPYGYGVPFEKLFEKKFIKVENSFNAQGGAPDHYHRGNPEKFIMDPTDDDFYAKAWSGNPTLSEKVCQNTHIHDINFTKYYTSSETNLPKYVNLRILERKEYPTNYYSVDIKYSLGRLRNWSCDGISHQEPSVCSSKGQCYSPDFCYCHTSYFGSSCQEKIEKGEYLNPQTILVPFEIRISEIDKYGSDEMKGYFNCSLMISDSQFSQYFDSSSSCVWISESLLFTKSLQFRNVKSSKIISLSIIPISFSQTRRSFSIPITPLPDPVIPVYSSPDSEEEPYDVTGLVLGLVLTPLFCCCFFGIICLALTCSLLTLVLITVPVVVCMIICCCVCCMFVIFFLCFCLLLQTSKLRKFQLIEDIDLILKEQEELGDRSIAHININKALFEIEYKDIKIKNRIGAGGSFSVVFQCSWQGREAAFKCFRTSDLCREDQDGNQFEEFELEVSILASICHPNILQFFGATLKPPRVGILMEYCEYGDLRAFLTDYENKFGAGKKLPVKDKLRFLVEISSAMSYIHSKKIIHRDLKIDNVLVTKNIISKLMDFGLSKVVESIVENKKITKCVGTSYSIAPEVVLGTYGSQCDVFSFSMVIYELMTENFHPYGKKLNFGIELKVANDPDFRPDVSAKCVRDGFKDCKWLVPIMQECWLHDPDHRPSFDIILDKMLNYGREVKDELEEDFDDENKSEEEEEESVSVEHKNKTDVPVTGKTMRTGGGIFSSFKNSMAYDYERIRKQNSGLRRILKKAKKEIELLRLQLNQRNKNKNNYSPMKDEDEEGKKRLLFERKKNAPAPPPLPPAKVEMLKRQIGGGKERGGSVAVARRKLFTNSLLPPNRSAPPVPPEE